MTMNGNSYSSELTLIDSEPGGTDLKSNGINGDIGREKHANGPSPIKPGVDYVNVGEDDQMEVLGFTTHRGLTIATWVLIVCTLFLLRLLFHWKPSWFLYMTNVRCKLEVAQKVLLIDHYNQFFVEPVILMKSSDIEFKSRASEEPGNKEEGGGGGTALRDFNGSTTNTFSGKLVLPNSQGSLEDVDRIRFFVNKNIKYIWNYESNEFSKLRGLEFVNCSFFYQQTGLCADDQIVREKTFGSNNIDVPVTSVLMLLFMEILSPFYVFQIFSVCLWYTDNYAYYATCIVIMSAFSITTTVLQIRKNEKALRNTIQSSDLVSVCRGKDVYETVPSDTLVPGDVISIPPRGCMMQCDAVLISGNCIVNESMLTGECVPVTKTPIPNSNNIRGGRECPYNAKEHLKHTLCCGTRVIQTRYYGSEKVKAVVIRTGFMTTKGELVRSIMFPKPVDFKFHRDSFKFVGILFVVAFCGFIYTVLRMVMYGATAREIVLDALDLITIAVPAALPAAMTIGIVYAQSRLKKQGIYCISPRSINISGCINCVCFDKTGTLTEEGIDMWGVVPVEDSSFCDVIHEVSTMAPGPFIIGMASCHSLTLIDGQLSGEPLELKMFEATSWTLEEPEIDETVKYDIITPTIVRPGGASPNVGPRSEIDTPFEVGIVRQFPFSSSLPRMSVITRVLGGKHFEIYCKGSPESIVALADPQSVPADFTDVLKKYTRHGYRVLALASKPLPKMTYAKVQRIARENVESNLTFLGLLVMENRLKPETNDTIEVLKRAEIRTVMITGDHMLTALSVARDCRMIEKNHKVILVNVVRLPDDKVPSVQFLYAEMPDQEVEEVEFATKDRTEVVIEQHGEMFHFAIDGKAYSVIKEYFPELMPKLVVRGTVFARMSPDQKQQIVEQLQDMGYYVGMCGDGANDCGALKTAHAGISLSEAEASVASPFTSKTPNISCVPTLIREGRAAMTTSFGIFKYMACYSLTQFCSVLILYSIESNLTDFEFLYIDLFLITVFAFVFGRTEAHWDLVKQQPPSSLISLTPLASLLVQMIIIIAFQVGALLFVRSQFWFTPFVMVQEDQVGCYENYAVFAVSSFQYITLVICFAKGAPYRKSVFSNHWFLGTVIVMTCATIYIVIYPFQWLQDLLSLVLPPYMEFRWLMVVFGLVNFVLCLIAEHFIIDFFVFQVLEQRFHSLQAMSTYRKVECEITSTPEWPPVLSDVDVASLPQYTETPTSAASPVKTGDDRESEGDDDDTDASDEDVDQVTRTLANHVEPAGHDHRNNHLPNGHAVTVPAEQLNGVLNRGLVLSPEEGTTINQQYVTVIDYQSSNNLGRSSLTKSRTPSGHDGGVGNAALCANNARRSPQMNGGCDVHEHTPQLNP